jgi:hypothetical protein
MSHSPDTKQETKTVATDAEILEKLNKGREKYAANKEKLIRFLAVSERAEKDLEEIRKEGMTKFGSASPVEIKTKLDAIRDKNIIDVETFLREQEQVERQMAAMESALSELEQQVSKA